MIVALPTVEHSGTHLAIALFKDAGFTKVHAPSLNGSGDLVVHEHFCGKHWAAFEQLLAQRECPIVIPLRRLHSIVISWEARSKPIHVLGERLERLTDYIDRDPYWLPIDAADRDDWLAEVNAGLNLSIDTDWPVLGSHRKTTGRPESLIRDTETYSALRERFGWFFDQVYRA